MVLPAVMPGAFYLYSLVMKRFFKIFGITLGSIVGLLLVVVLVLCYLVFTPERLTPIVNKYADEFITCDYKIDDVELTFFSSFPDFALRVNDVTLLNPMAGAPSDTLLHVSSLSASIQLMDFIRYQAVVVQHVELDDGIVNIYRENDSIANYNIFKLSATDEEEDTTSSSLSYLGLNMVALNNVNVRFVDRSLHMDAEAQGVSASVSGQFFTAEGGELDVNAELLARRLAVDYGDSTRIRASVGGFKLSAEGLMEQMHFDGEVATELHNTDFSLNDDRLVHDRLVKLVLPADVNLKELYANLHKGTKLSVDDNEIELQGKVDLCDNGDIYMGVSFETNKWDIERTLALVPARYASMIKDYKASGKLKLKGRVNGTLASDNYPLVFADVELEDAAADIPQLPFSISKASAAVHADMNINPGQTTDVVITGLKADADRIHVEAKGRVDDLLGRMACNLNVKGRLPLEELHKVLPEDLKLRLKGDADLDVNAAFCLADLTKLDLTKIRANGHIDYHGLDVLYNDSIHVSDREGRIRLNLPSKHKNKVFTELGEVGIDGDRLNINMVGTMKAQAGKPKLTVGFGDILNDKHFLEAHLQFDFERLEGSMDTITFNLASPRGSATIFPMKAKPKQPGITAAINSAQVDARMGRQLSVKTKALALSGFTTYEESNRNILVRLNPSLKVELKEGDVRMAGLSYPVEIPEIKFDFTPRKLDIANSRIILGSSDFGLAGEVTNITEFIEGSALLRGTLNFTSQKTNVDELMALVNGMGTSEAELADKTQTPAEAEADKEANPFIVPKGIDLTLHTNIAHAVFEGRDIKQVRGGVTIKDGVLIADQLGFTADAGRMQLTAIYRSPRRNHLFLGLDFHLLKIDIHELISMIPSIDTIVPMLKSFDGKAEFHLAAETYLNARYEPKLSTMRGAAAIEGRDLVVLDNETFSTIAKYMMFNKKTRNVIDSLSVEATLFRSEVDVYPFLLTMDKWQAVLAGRHNLNNTFNYHISLTDCPLPVRLGLDVYGDFDKPRFKLVSCQYKALYKPERRGATEERTLALKKMISDALKANVRDEE